MMRYLGTYTRDGSTRLMPGPGCDTESAATAQHELAASYRVWLSEIAHPENVDPDPWQESARQAGSRHVREAVPLWDQQGRPVETVVDLATVALARQDSRLARALLRHAEQAVEDACDAHDDDEWLAACATLHRLRVLAGRVAKPALVVEAELVAA